MCSAIGYGTHPSALGRKTGASKSGLCRFFRRRCAGCRIDSGSAAFKKTALAVGKAPSDGKVYDEKGGENWDKSPQKKWDKGVTLT